MIEQDAYSTSCNLIRNILYCSINSDIKDIDFAFYIAINGVQKKQFWYSNQKSIEFDCENEIVHTYKISFFLREKNGDITSLITEKKTNWAVCDGIIETVKLLLNKSSLLLEFGSGFGSKQLAEYCSVQSIEHDERFVGLFPGVSYIHSPLIEFKPFSEFKETQWYDFSKIEADLEEHYDLILIDGPPAEYGRSGILYHMERLDKSPLWIIDDVLRHNDQLIANYIALQLSMIQYRFWNFSILAKEPIENAILAKIHDASKATLLDESNEYITRYYPSYTIKDSIQT